MKLKILAAIFAVMLALGPFVLATAYLLPKEGAWFGVCVGVLTCVLAAGLATIALLYAGIRQLRKDVAAITDHVVGIYRNIGELDKRYTDALTTHDQRLQDVEIRPYPFAGKSSV